MADDLALLFAALSAVQSPEELGQLLEDWLTPHEQEELVLRLDIARRLNRGQTYEVIQAETKASSTTVSRVRRCLTRGAGGYRLVLDRMEPRRR
ncbi:MAG: YerC/YecD family TrpR-related protein [Thermaerobacter sp.]|nr:YerC/YecD family TrpR-related protein [Thermaerobacter sp.]